MKKYLLDTNIVIWSRTADSRLGAEVSRILQDAEEYVYYSIINPWEIAIKHALGKLPLPKDFFNILPKQGFAFLPVTEHHVQVLRTLPPLHRDPFDRMLVAQAYAEKMILITSDERLTAYPIKTLMATA